MNIIRKIIEKSTGLVLGSALVLITALPAESAENRPGLEETRKHDWRQMEQRLQDLEEELARERAEAEKKQDSFLPEYLAEHFELNGLVELEAFTSEGYGGESASDVVVSAVELDLHALVNDWARGHILLLWEEDASANIEVDEAVVFLGNPEKLPFFINVGKMYVPFGTYGTYLIQDPLTLEIGESNETALQAGVEYNDFFGTIYVFNGDMDEKGGNDSISNFGTSMGYGFAGQATILQVSLDFISNLADSDMLTDTLQGMGVSAVVDHVAGIGAHLQVQHGPFTLYTEYITALEEFDAAELAFQGQGAEPSAWHAELAYTREILNRETDFALSYQGTRESVNLGLPESRYMAGINIALNGHFFLAFEYVHDEDYAAAEGGTGESLDMFTTQLAFEF